MYYMYMYMKQNIAITHALNTEHIIVIAKTESEGQPLEIVKVEFTIA